VKQEKGFKMAKVRKEEMWGKITGTNSKSDEIPHPIYHVEAYGCSSLLLSQQKETEKLQRMGEKQRTLPEWKSGSGS